MAAGKSLVHSWLQELWPQLSFFSAHNMAASSFGLRQTSGCVRNKVAPVIWCSCPSLLPRQHPQTHEFYFTLYYYRHASSSLTLSSVSFSSSLERNFFLCLLCILPCIGSFYFFSGPDSLSLILNYIPSPSTVTAGTISVLLPVLCHRCHLFFPYFSPKLSPFSLNCHFFLHSLYLVPLT